MTDHRPTDADRLAPPAPGAPKPYDAPSLLPLGQIDALTAGPSSAGQIDTLFGDDGGFREPDTTS